MTKETQKEITSGKFSTLVRLLLDLHKRWNQDTEATRKDDGGEVNVRKLQAMQSY